MQNKIRPDAPNASMHVCFVTDDIDGTVAWFADLVGEDSPIRLEQSPPEIARATLHGQPAVIGFRQALIVWQGTMFEFIEPDENPSTWRDWLDRHGRSVHHIGFGVHDLDATTGEFVSEGFRCTQTGYFPGGRYAFADTEERLGAFIELLGAEA
jgi:methylmalonyl-CoA/ethylmalonyl-CoA epimerase